MADAPTENHSQMAPTHPTSDESALSFSKAFSRPSFPRFSVPPTQGGIWQVHQGDSYQVHQGGREVPALYFRCPVSLLSNCK